ncbi:ribonuclease H-like domain-containing protein [Tanacetum coccineum]
MEKRGKDKVLLGQETDIRWQSKKIPLAKGKLQKIKGVDCSAWAQRQMNGQDGFGHLSHTTSTRSYAEAEYRSIATATCVVIWLSNMLGDMGVKGLLLVVMYCDNSSTLQIAANPVFHASIGWVLDYYML